MPCSKAQRGHQDGKFQDFYFFHFSLFSVWLFTSFKVVKLMWKFQDKAKTGMSIAMFSVKKWRKSRHNFFTRKTISSNLRQSKGWKRFYLDFFYHDSSLVGSLMVLLYGNLEVVEGSLIFTMVNSRLLWFFANFGKSRGWFLQSLYSKLWSKMVNSSSVWKKWVDWGVFGQFGPNSFLVPTRVP